MVKKNLKGEKFFFCKYLGLIVSHDVLESPKRAIVVYILPEEFYVWISLLPKTLFIYDYKVVYDRCREFNVVLDET